MADRVYPSNKQPSATANGGTGGGGGAALHPPPAAAAAAGNTAAPPSSAKPYNNRPYPYRPQTYHNRRPRRRCCTCCCTLFWVILIFLLLLLLVAIAGAAFWVFYRPHAPSFSVTSLKLSTLNLTTTNSDTAAGHLTSSLNLTLSAQNPNKKITFFYGPFFISVFSSDVLIANGTSPAFDSPPKDVNDMRVRMVNSRDLDTQSVTNLRSDLKKKTGLPLELKLETKLRVKIGKLKTKNVGIKIHCDGIHVTAPQSSKSAASVASTSKAKCTVNVKIKIWKFTF